MEYGPKYLEENVIEEILVSVCIFYIDFFNFIIQKLYVIEIRFLTRIENKRTI